MIKFSATDSCSHSHTDFTMGSFSFLPILQHNNTSICYYEATIIVTQKTSVFLPNYNDKFLAFDSNVRAADQVCHKLSSH